MIEIHPQQIHGNWTLGFALDLHTTSSTPSGNDEHGHMQFDTIRPPIAELLFQLKYRSKQSGVKEIVAAASTFLKTTKLSFDLICPVPGSNIRRVQPVILLANELGKSMNIPVVNGITTTRPTSQLKNVSDPNERAALVKGLYIADAHLFKGKVVLLFDDLYRSGSTLNAISKALLEDGKASAVKVLTITRTRSNR